jgi:hypothetical protein
MFTAKRYIISLTLFFLVINLPAQNLTGTWEGDLGTDQFLQLNIIQTGNKICGYTHDHVKKDSTSFCKAFFEGYFDEKKQRLVINGKYFLKNSGSHILMYLKLKLKKNNGAEILEQKPATIILYRQRPSLFGFDIEPYIADDSTEYVYIKKVADQPYELIELMKDCIARDKKMGDTVVKIITPPKSKDSLPAIVKTTTPEKPKDSLPPVVKIIVPEKPRDSLPRVVIAPVKKDSIVVPKTVNQRKNVEQSRIEVNVKTINLKVYDNAIVDGDTVSILYNGKMLLTHQLLSEKGIELNIELDEKQTRHEITLFAENLGSIPPNTALVVITAGKKRFELFASASLEENAVLVFDYKPK